MCACHLLHIDARRVPQANKGPSAGPPRLGQKGIAPITVTCIDQVLTWQSGSAAVRTGYAEID